MIDVAVSWEDGDLKEALTYTIANHMKKCFLNWNKDTVEDDVIFNHLFELSDGKINLKGSREALVDSVSLLKTTSKKKYTNTSSKKGHQKKNNNSSRGKKRY